MREAIVIERKAFLEDMIQALKLTQFECAIRVDCAGCASCSEAIDELSEELALLSFEPRSGALKL